MKYKCEICGCQLASNVTLKRHQQSLHEEKTTQKNHLKKHQQSLQEIITFPCGSCGSQFSNSGNLSAHRKSVHEERKYPVGCVTIRQQPAQA